MNCIAKRLLAILLVCINGPALSASYKDVEDISKKTRIVSYSFEEAHHDALKINFAYFYDGSESGEVRISAIARRDGVESPLFHPMSKPLIAGQHSSSFVILKTPAFPFEVTTNEFVLRMYVMGGQGRSPKTLDTKLVSYDKIWPSSVDAGSLTDESIQDLYEGAIFNLGNDKPAQMETARKQLELILSVKPGYVPAYEQLARYTLKMDELTRYRERGETDYERNSPALKRAEEILKKGISFDGKHANSHVLLGYVFTSMERYKDAESEFRLAEKIGTPNAWLHTNFANLLIKTNRPKEALAHLELAITSDKNAFHSNENAINSAYRAYEKLLQDRQDWGGVDRLLTRYLNQFPTEKCVVERQAKNQLLNLNKPDFVLLKEKELRALGCSAESSSIIASAYLLKWELSDRKDHRLVSSAKIYAENMVSVIEMLAASKDGQLVLNSMPSAGIAVDAVDQNGMTALARVAASEQVNATAAKALLLAKADPNFRLNNEGWTPFLIAVASGKVELIPIFVKYGADKSSRLSSGHTAADMARMSGRADMVDALTKSGI